jgi:hypothetical protein
MKFLEDILFTVLESLGFEITKFSLGDLFPGVIIGLFPAAFVGGAVSDWKYGKQSAFITAVPWEWIASILTMLACIWSWYRLAIA